MRFIPIFLFFQNRDIGSADTRIMSDPDPGESRG